MLTLTTKSQYGVTAVMHIAARYGQGLVQLRDIADTWKIPKNYLEQLFNLLTKAGIIRSTRGSKGGYELATLPSKITLLQVLEVLEGKVAFTRYHGLTCVNEVYEKLQKEAIRQLSIPLSDMISRQKEIDKNFMYYI